MAFGAWSSDYPAVTTFINEFFSCRRHLATAVGILRPSDR